MKQVGPPIEVQSELFRRTDSYNFHRQLWFYGGTQRSQKLYRPQAGYDNAQYIGDSVCVECVRVCVFAPRVYCEHVCNEWWRTAIQFLKMGAFPVKYLGGLRHTPRLGHSARRIHKVVKSFCWCMIIFGLGTCFQKCNNIEYFSHKTTSRIYVYLL